MPTSSIDDVLLASAQTVSQQPEPEPVKEETVQSLDEYSEREPGEREEPSSAASIEPQQEEVTESEQGEPEKALDDYGNEKISKMYTEDEVNERINKAVRDRLARIERSQTPRQVQEIANQTASNFEFNENSGETWQQQLESFVKQTVNKMSTEQVRVQQQQQEQRAQQEFESRFHSGMTKFSDFVDVVGSQPITDAMTVATRSVQDPAAFLYAASKRAPEELARIARIADPYAQIAEMGKLEEKLRKGKQATSAPKPVAKTQGDSKFSSKENKSQSIDDLLAESDRRRKANLAQTRPGYIGRR